ncbi:MAG: hypothetical protein R2705_03215 [Ilumatobacteraceae bacterium]
MSAAEPELGREFSHQIDLLQTAVTRRRPGDATFAADILEQLSSTYLERHPG